MLMEISGNILCVANGRPAAPAARRSTGWPLFQQFQMVSGLKPLPLGGTLKWRGWREELTGVGAGAIAIPNLHLGVSLLRL